MLSRFLKRLLTPVLLTFAAIVIAAEELLWQLAKVYALLGKLPVFRAIEAWIQRLPPYGALVLLGLPGLALAPIKLLAFYWLASGHAILGGGTIVTAKIAGTAFVARLYQLTRPALLQIGWFAWAEFQVLRLRAAAYGIWADSAIGRVVLQRMRMLREWLRAWRQRRRSWIARRWQAIRLLLRASACWLMVASFTANGQVPPGERAYQDFLVWQSALENRGLKWDAATAKYRAKLIASGMNQANADQTMSIIASRDESALYDPMYAGKTPANLTRPTALLAEAVRNRMPGRALDVGMGQGRNSIFLAKLGWDVVGFDVSKAGLEQAQKLAAQAGVNIRTEHVSDEEFDFGTNAWDLIAILYPIEKRSVHRVRQALKPGGIVVVECGHKESGGAPFEYDSNELLKIFDGFRILKYEETVARHEWANKDLRLVRLIAQKNP